MTPIFVACGLAAFVASIYTFILPTWDAVQAKKKTQSAASPTLKSSPEKRQYAFRGPQKKSSQNKSASTA